MKLLITTLTMIFISFNSFSMAFWDVERVGDLMCYNALMKGEIISHDVKESTYSVRWSNNIYNFKAGFTEKIFKITDCRRIKDVKGEY
jgi:hypothetical protein